MKRILDRLLERQQRLLSNLSSDAPAPNQRRPARAAPPLPGEEEALAEALVELERGDLRTARSILEPHRHRAGLARTVLTLARMALAAGDIEEAESLLVRAEKMDSEDPKIWWVFAEIYRRTHRFDKELHYRRRLVYAEKSPSLRHDLDLLRAVQSSTPKGRSPLASEIELTAERILKSPDLPDDDRAAVAEALFSVPRLAARAQSEFARAFPLQPGEYDTLAGWVRLTTWCGVRSAALSRLHDGGIEGRRPTLATLPGAWIHPRLKWNPVLDEGHSMITGMLDATKLARRRTHPGSPLLLVGTQAALLRMQREPRRIKGHALLVGGDDDHQRNILEYVGSLAVAEQLAGARDVPLVVGAGAPGVSELLELLSYGGNERIVVQPDEWVRFDALDVATRPTAGHRWVDPLLPRWYRERLTQGIPSGKRKLLLKPPSDDGLVMNDDIVAHAKQHGYDVVAPDKLSMSQTIEVFAQTQAVISPVCAALTNIVFMPQGSRVVLLAQRQILQPGASVPFDALANACGHDFRVVAGAPLHSGSATSATQGSYVVDPAELLAVL